MYNYSLKLPILPHKLKWNNFNPSRENVPTTGTYATHLVILGF